MRNERFAGHDLDLFIEDEMRAAFEAAGLTVDFDPVGLENRGLYIGTKWSVWFREALPLADYPIT